MGNQLMLWHFGNLTTIHYMAWLKSMEESLKWWKSALLFLKKHSPHTFYFSSIEIMELWAFLKTKMQFKTSANGDFFPLKINEKIIWFLLFIINVFLHHLPFWSSLNVTKSHFLDFHLYITWFEIFCQAATISIF